MKQHFPLLTTCALSIPFYGQVVVDTTWTRAHSTHPTTTTEWDLENERERQPTLMASCATLSCCSFRYRRRTLVLSCVITADQAHKTHPTTSGYRRTVLSFIDSQRLTLRRSIIARCDVGSSLSRALRSKREITSHDKLATIYSEIKMTSISSRTYSLPLVASNTTVGKILLVVARQVSQKVSL